MGRLGVVAALGLAAWLVTPAASASQALPVSEECVECHLSLDDERLVSPARDYPDDLHSEVGFGCLSCHGSGGEGTLAPSLGFLSAPDRSQIPRMCGRCHSDGAYMRQFDPGLRVDQVAEYQTSTHGRLLQDGDPDVATCVSCHPAHAMRPPDDPESTVHPTNIVSTCASCHADQDVMADRDIPTDQAEDYRSSVHAQLLEDGDLTAPVCNDCHGNHGAAPPGISSVRNVCGQCHAVMADYFDASDHQEVFDEQDLPGCATCHEHHAIQSVSNVDLEVRAEEVCRDCHDGTDPAAREFERMAEILDSLAESTEHARELLHQAEDLGMEVSQAFFELEDVTNARTRARSAIHTFQAEAVEEEAAEGFTVTEAAAQRGLEALDQNEYRRMGLGVFAGIVLLLVAALLMKIRSMDTRADQVARRVAELYSASISAGPAGAGGEQRRAGACALLLEAAYGEETFTDRQLQRVREVVREKSGLPRQRADELISAVEAQGGVPGEIDRFASHIADHYSPEDRRGLLRELWRLVYADEVLVGREVTFLERVAKLLHLDPEVLAEERRTAMNASGTGPGHTD